VDNKAEDANGQANSFVVTETGNFGINFKKVKCFGSSTNFCGFWQY
jgi:hypothetical protein